MNLSTEFRVNIRSAALEDAGKLAYLLTQLGYAATREDVKTRLESLLQIDSHRVFVAEHGGEVAGMPHALLRSSLRAGQEVEVDSLVTDEQYRGRGIGKSLLDAIEEWANEQAISTISLSTNVRRTETHAFYLRRGFSEAKRSIRFRREIQ